MRIPRSAIVHAATLFGSGARAADASFDAVVATPGLWTLKQDEFQQATPTLPFQWTSAAHDSARAARPAMTLFGLPVVEAIARFDADKLASFTANIYARGDAGELTKERFDKLVRDSVAAITKATNVKFTDRGKDPTNAVKAEGLLWKTPASLFTLEYSFTREVKTRGIPFRAEFVRLEITPLPKGVAAFSTAAPSTLRFNPLSHIQRDTVSGDTYIKDVPMVDQGQKGYCVVASAERVMRYYGGSVDANELAQIANSDAGGGTSYQSMIEALRKVAARLKVRVREVEKMDVKDTLALIKDYNRAAKKDGANQIPDPGHFIDMGAIYGAMNAGALREAHTKNKSDLSRFQREVAENIDKGIPLLWTVHLGILPDKNVPQSGGGHMRLIIGYNTKTNEVLFSDSWGAGHELKRMPAVDAWTITTGITKIEPLS